VLALGVTSRSPSFHGRRQLAELNPYAAPQGAFEMPHVAQENTSGMGKGYPLPEGVKGWSWGAFLLNWIWSIGNNTYIGLLSLLPYVGFVFTIWLGVKGRELAWQNKRWNSVEHFNEVQRKWSMWGAILTLGFIGLAIFAGVVAAVLPHN
jgi:hypothetical protein